ncbi:hypothetical protein BU26DRAFT_561075 [Trematosphaeria pertusa]|uniref:DUF7730 domain-containing protein n=1 Tax=Trematosphaeria pertusa TaxID=390896 RepID=A0A6A6IX87_9PLEO|nr:uncharacterized protein BU26DRAFT_561075 [Trematosphaeria pertusa]KAF2253803.1 hypothetical protein BU26DRAFT_561075 [Trematosphaeria pertusa]
MSTRPTEEAPINPQVGSKFFSAPLEIRQMIYGYIFPYGVHAYLRQGKLHSSACVEPRANGDYDGGERRDESSDWRTPGPIWSRRLQSSWGPHWKCEEVALSMGRSWEAAGDADMVMLRACKRMYIDIMTFIVDIAAVHVTDLDTLGCLLQEATTVSPGTWTVSGYLATALPLVRNLSVVLRLPLTTCKILESSSDHGSAPTSTTNATAWFRLCPAIARLKRLLRLHIWLDHDGESSWSVVNERAILSPLTALTDISGLDISVSLPHLHHRYETPERHFVKQWPSPPFTIERRLRQRYHVVETDPGRFDVSYQADFPYLYNYYRDLSEDEVE